MIRRALFVVSIAVGMLIAAGQAASAASSVEAGWWTAAPVAPDAPSDGLVVQGGADPTQPFAYSAIAYALDPNETASSLRLTVAQGTVSTPATLTLCPLMKSFAPAQGGAMADAPPYNCTNKATAAVSADGTSYTFKVAALARDDELAVAVLPSTVTDRVVLDEPTLDSLATKTKPSGTAASDEPSTFTKATETSSAPSTNTGAGSVPPAPQLAAPPPAPTAVTPQAPIPPAPVPPVTASSSETPNNDSPWRAALFGGLALLAAALWVYAGGLRSRSPKTT